MQADRKRQQDQANKPAPLALSPSAATEPTRSNPTKRKRQTQPEDEIDAVFNATLGKRIKKAALGDVAAAAPLVKVKKSKKEPRTTDGLQDVLGAIRIAPKDEKTHGKRGRH